VFPSLALSEFLFFAAEKRRKRSVPLAVQVEEGGNALTRFGPGPLGIRVDYARSPNSPRRGGGRHLCCRDPTHGPLSEVQAREII
jgi:hypothetical protein